MAAYTSMQLNGARCASFLIEGDRQMTGILSEIEVFDGVSFCLNLAQPLSLGFSLGMRPILLVVS